MSHHSHRRLLATAAVGAIVLSGALAGCSQDVTIDQSSPERLVYTMLLANANGQDQDVKAVMIADGTTQPWGVDDPSEIIYCDAENASCDHYGAQLSDGSCPATTSDVEAIEGDITVRYERAAYNDYGLVYDENSRAVVTVVENSCGFGAFDVNGEWVIRGY
ncbi:hypothetical protein GZ998_05545 [Actinomyces sp. 594]|uniref:hypothetical protein n=1 Tax=Actinomyces sp. 594 TaxID=2057793 RepID=UPI001C58864B|nr:hypothetical protein [Actinomyces sp. 594]MBW3068977.1 hypothetical protein [Actinomyces sp. 594]